MQTDGKLEIGFDGELIASGSFDACSNGENTSICLGAFTEVEERGVRASASYANKNYYGVDVSSSNIEDKAAFKFRSGNHKTSGFGNYRSDKYEDSKTYEFGIESESVGRSAQVFVCLLYTSPSPRDRG